MGNRKSVPVCNLEGAYAPSDICYMDDLPEPILARIIRPRAKQRKMLCEYFNRRRVCRRWRDLIDLWEHALATQVLSVMGPLCYSSAPAWNYALSRLNPKSTVAQWVKFLDTIYYRGANEQQAIVLARYVPCDMFLEWLSGVQSKALFRFSEVGCHFWEYEPLEWPDEKLRKVLAYCVVLLRAEPVNDRWIALLLRIVPLLDQQEYEKLYCDAVPKYASAIVEIVGNIPSEDGLETVFDFVKDLLKRRADLFCNEGERCFYRCINHQYDPQDAQKAHPLLEKVFARLWEERNALFDMGRSKNKV